MERTACVYFQRGYCSRGEKCFYLHDNSNEAAGPSDISSPTAPRRPRVRMDRALKPEAPEFVFGGSPPQLPASSNTTKTDASTPCRFFAGERGCRYGDACRFSHDTEESQTIPDTEVVPTTWRRNSRTSIASPTSPPSSLVWRKKSIGTSKSRVPREIHSGSSDPRLQATDTTLPLEISSLVLDEKRETEPESVCNIDGAKVTFTDGAAVSKMELPMDYHTVQITGLPGSSTSNSVAHLLEACGVNIPASSIRMTTTITPGTGEAALVAEIGDQTLEAAKMVSDTLGSDAVIRVHITQQSSSSASANRLQMNSVTCSWYKPCRTAWLNYDDISALKRAEALFKKTKILGRQPICSVQRHWAYDSGSLRLSGLEASVTKEDILSALGRMPPPTSCHVSPRTYDIISSEAQGDIIQRRLAEHGTISSWEIFDDRSSDKVKAVARFISAQEAKKAAKEMHDSKIPEFENTKAFVTVIASVKFKVLNRIYTAVEKEINAIKIEAGGPPAYVQVKYYPSTSYQKTRDIRVSGQDVKAVARVKGQIEKALRGTAADDEEGSIWHPFFATPAALKLFEDVQMTCLTFVYSDLRRSKLTLYGTPVGISNALVILRKKVEELKEISFNIHVTADELSWLLRGGLRTLRSILGPQSAVLNVAARPPTLKLKGSDTDVREAVDSLQSKRSSTKEHQKRNAIGGQSDDCTTCWSEAGDGIRAGCNHLFCKECFANLCTSAVTNGDFPISCVGLNGPDTCQHAFSLEELSSALSPKEYQNLLERSVGSFVRKQPHEYQYCPSPNCDQIYRVGAAGSDCLFTCPDCLTIICTACGISHDGLTCEESQDLRSGGDLAFKKYKESHNVKDCPECKTPIERIDGCNHMTCSTCQTHICWKCLACFKTGPETYAHMSAEHGGAFDFNENEVVIF